MGTDHIYHIDG